MIQNDDFKCASETVRPIKILPVTGKRSWNNFSVFGNVLKY